MIDRHNKLRLNYESIKQSIAYHSDFHIKPVWDGKNEGALAVNYGMYFYIRC